MVSLATTFANIELQNPVIVASSPATENLGNIIKCSRAGAAAVVTKSIADYDRNKTSARIESGQRRVLFSSGFMHYQPISVFEHRRKEVPIKSHKDSQKRRQFKTWIISTFQRETLPLKKGIKLVKEAKKHVNIPIISSVAATSYQIDQSYSTCQVLESAGADAIELSLFYLPNPCGSSNAEKLVSLLRFLHRNLSIPVIVKLHIEIPAHFAADMLKNLKINGISYLDSVEGPPPIDIGRGKCYHHSVENPKICSIFGQWQRPLTLRYTHVLSRSTGLPLCAGGGLLDGFDVIELIMLGASVTQFASSIMVFGYGWITQIIDHTTELLHDLGYDDINEIRGLAYRYFGEADETSFQEVKAQINQDLCIHSGEMRAARELKCDKCLNLAICDAIIEMNKTVQINPRRCEGCGLCVAVCPEGAIEFIRHGRVL